MIQGLIFFYYINNYRCLMATYLKYITHPLVGESTNKQAECHRVNCRLENGVWTAEVYFSNQVIICPPEGGDMTLGVDLRGVLHCPKLEDLCRSFENNICPLNCSNRGRCQKGVCVCYPGWTGEICEKGLEGDDICIFPIDGYTIIFLK